MRLRDVKGKRITGVRQVRFFNANNRVMETDVLALILEDGTTIRPITIETAYGEYAHQLVVHKPIRARKGQTT